MSVITLVQRALPIAFSWKRRSTRKGKAKVVKVSDHDSNEGNLQSRNTDGRHPSTALPSDVPDTLHIAVKPDSYQDKIPDNKSSEDFETDEGSDSQSEDLIHRLSSNDEPARPQQFRTVSWANIAHHEHRWASRQEEELSHARKQLTRCQKAWSSEQELWLDYVRSFVSFFFFSHEISPCREIDDRICSVTTARQYILMRSPPHED